MKKILDIEKIRSEFPMLHHAMHENPLSILIQQPHPKSHNVSSMLSPISIKINTAQFIEQSMKQAYSYATLPRNASKSASSFKCI